MFDELIRLAIAAAGAIASAGLTALLNIIKSKMSAKTRAKVEEIAAVVEQLYDGCAAADKLAAFKDLCKSKGINVEKAVDYLERYIIPLSKKINVYTTIAPAETNKTDADATN